MSIPKIKILQHHKIFCDKTTQSAKLNNLDPWHYIFYILNHVHDLRKGNIKAENLLPHNVNPDDVANLATQHIEKFTKLLHGLNNSS